MKHRQRTHDMIDEARQRESRRVCRKGLLMNATQFVGITKRQRRQHGVPIGKELIERSLRGVGFECDGFGSCTLHSKPNDYCRCGVEQQVDPTLAARLAGLAAQRVVTGRRRRD